jgi:hypothetical protein
MQDSPLFVSSEGNVRFSGVGSSNVSPLSRDHNLAARRVYQQHQLVYASPLATKDPGI